MWRRGIKRKCVWRHDLQRAVRSNPIQSVPFQYSPIHTYNQNTNAMKNKTKKTTIKPIQSVSNSTQFNRYQSNEIQPIQSNHEPARIFSDRRGRREHQRGSSTRVRRNNKITARLSGTGTAAAGSARNTRASGGRRILRLRAQRAGEVEGGAGEAR